jgi:hypothetical protein
MVLAFIGLLLVAIAAQIGRDRARQLPLGNGTLGQSRPGAAR